MSTMEDSNGNGQPRHGRKQRDDRESWSEKKLVAVCSLVAAVVSAATSFGASYLQREAEYSLEKARYFHNLIDSLTPTSEERTKANLALLSLWQLFSRDDERKIIILSAVEVENSDIIRTLAAFGDELKPYQRYLEAAAQSENRGTSDAARRLLNFIDYDRRLDGLVNAILEQESGAERPHLGSVDYQALRQLLNDVPEAAKLLVERHGKSIKTSALLSYALYETRRETTYLESLIAEGTTNPETFGRHFLVVANAPDLPFEAQRQLHHWAAGYLECSLKEPPECAGSSSAQDAAIHLLARARVSAATDIKLRRRVAGLAEAYLALPRIEERDSIRAFNVMTLWPDDDFSLKDEYRVSELLRTMPALRTDLSKRVCRDGPLAIPARLKEQLRSLLHCDVP